MRVLMVNRDDAFAVPGGDTVQMVESARGLKKLGVDVQISTVGERYAVNEFDLIHVFNWDQFGPMLDRCQPHKGDPPPVVLSPIFMFQTGHWFDDALATKSLWRAMHTALGNRRSRAVYDRWQEIKLSRSLDGKRVRDCLLIPAHLLPNSQHELQCARSVCSVEPGSKAGYTLVPNGVMAELYDPKPKPGCRMLEEIGVKNFVLQVSRIQAAKNQLGLIEALYDTPLPIVFVGQPSPFEPEYVQHCYELGKKRGNVYFLGPRPPQELPGIYAMAAVHVLPSWCETVGLVSLEAAAAGCKVVSTIIGGAREYFGGRIRYCDPRNPSSIKKAVLATLEEPGNGSLRDLVLTHYTWDIAAQKTLEGYKRALG